MGSLSPSALPCGILHSCASPVWTSRLSFPRPRRRKHHPPTQFRRRQLRGLTSSCSMPARRSRYTTTETQRRLAAMSMPSVRGSRSCRRGYNNRHS